MKVPKIRFKGFEGAWEEEKLWNLWKTYTWLSWKTKNDFWHGEWLFIPYINIFSNTIVNERKLEQVEIDKNQNEVMYWDFFFTTSSETPKEVWMTSVRLGNKENIYLNSFCFWYRFSIDINYYFTSYMFRSNVFREKIILLAQWISRYNISKNKTLEISISLPSLPEQEKIWALFEQLDSHISKNQQKLEKLKNMKHSFLQKLFPKAWTTVPELRFKGFEGAWKEKKLGEICNKIKEKNTNWIFSETFTNSAEFWIISQKDFFDHDISNIENLKWYYIVENNDFVYNPRISNFAPVWPINRNKLRRTWVMSPLYTILRFCWNNFIFLEYLFKNSVWHNYMFLNWDSGARSDRFSIKDDVFFKMPLRIPSLPEQEKIWALFEKLDTQTQKLEKLKNLKQSLLEKMFI